MPNVGTSFTVSSLYTTLTLMNNPSLHQIVEETLEKQLLLLLLPTNYNQNNVVSLTGLIRFNSIIILFKRKLNKFALNKKTFSYNFKSFPFKSRLYLFNLHKLN